MQSAKALLIETPRAWQAGFAIVPLKTEHSDDSISGAQEWLHQNFQQTFPLEAPAGRVGMSLRNFVRRFKQATGDSPLIYLQKLRVAAAKRLLEGKHRTMGEISDAVGYQDAAFFRRLSSDTPGSPPAHTGEVSDCSADRLPRSNGRRQSESATVCPGQQRRSGFPEFGTPDR